MHFYFPFIPGINLNHLLHMPFTRSIGILPSISWNNQDIQECFTIAVYFRIMLCVLDRVYFIHVSWLIKYVKLDCCVFVYCKRNTWQISTKFFSLNQTFVIDHHPESKHADGQTDAPNTTFVMWINLVIKKKKKKRRHIQKDFMQCAEEFASTGWQGFFDVRLSGACNKQWS